MIPSNLCKCGRAWIHCYKCGSHNLYALMRDTEIASRISGIEIRVFRCKYCGVTTSTNDLCIATNLKVAVETFKRVQEDEAERIKNQEGREERPRLPPVDKPEDSPVTLSEMMRLAGIPKREEEK